MENIVNQWKKELQRFLIQQRNQNLDVLFFGAGAIGGSVGAWIASEYDNIYMLDQGQTAEAMKAKGITVYQENKKEDAITVNVNVIDDLSQMPNPDVIVISVKNYSLEAVSKFIKQNVTGEPVIVALQNGVENQSILPRYFHKIIYGVISYNAWFDEPGVIGYQKKGPLILGTLDNSLKSEMEAVSAIFNLGVETIITDHFQDAAHSKMVINLTNSLTTLIGLGYRDVSNMSVFQTLLSNLIYEGVQIVKAAGYKECKLGGMPGWNLIQASAKLPQFLTRPIFEKNVRKMVLSSMAQDILQRKGHDSELESLNGYFIRLAKTHNVKAPYNQAIYELCRQEFAKESFTPLDVMEVWEYVK